MRGPLNVNYELNRAAILSISGGQQGIYYIPSDAADELYVINNDGIAIQLVASITGTLRYVMQPDAQLNPPTEEDTLWTASAANTYNRIRNSSLSGDSATFTLPAGEYTIHSIIEVTNSTLNRNQTIQNMYIDGSAYSSGGQMSYIRNANGHNTATSHFTDSVYQTSTFTLRMTHVAAANTGVTTGDNSSRIIIIKTK